MAEIPALTPQDLADFSGRSVDSYTNYSEQAIIQATLLFKIGTCLVALGDDETEAQLAKMAIAAFADHVYLARAYAKAAASPFSSESLGSYSYSKSASQVAKGEKTGVFWFDLAVEKLGRCHDNDDVPEFGGIEVFEHDGTFVVSMEGNVRLLSPQDRQDHEQFLHDPSAVISRN